MERSTLSSVLGSAAILFSLYFSIVPTVFAQGETVTEIERMKAKYDAKYSIADLAPTVCAAAGLRAPKESTANAIKEVLEPMNEAFQGRKAQKIFIDCADCMGDVLWRDHPDEFVDVKKEADAILRSTNVMTMVTPVCYATIFTGAEPKVHGIVEYMRPIVKIDTLFDSFLEAGKKIAIISEPNFSVVKIFRERDMTYIDEPDSEPASFQKALQTLREGDFDVIVWHEGEYDIAMHAYGTESEQAANARRSVLSRWLQIIAATDEVWADYDRLVVFAPDHGSHTPEGSTHGTHGYDVLKDAGDDSYEDGVVNHIYRWRAAKSLEK